MRVLLIRHAACQGNLERRYVGCRTDEPLCEQGVRVARDRAPVLVARLASIGMAVPERVRVSPLLRARQTASLLFPTARLEPIVGLREMDFGDFEGRSADEMAEDGAYRSWVDGGCEGVCPGGESREGFVERTCTAFADVIAAARAAQEKAVVVVAHDGTLMAVLHRYASASRAYFSWGVETCDGYVADVPTSEGLEIDDVAELRLASG